MHASGRLCKLPVATINHGRNNTSFDNFLVDITGCNAACSSSHPAGKTRNFFLTVSTSNSDFLLFGF